MILPGKTTWTSIATKNKEHYVNNKNQKTKNKMDAKKQVMSSKMMKSGKALCNGMENSMNSADQISPAAHIRKVKAMSVKKVPPYKAH